MTSERDGLKAKLRKTELDLEQIKTENQGFREERDRLRRRVGTLVCSTSQEVLVTRKPQSKMSYWVLVISVFGLKPLETSIV